MATKAFKPALRDSETCGSDRTLRPLIPTGVRTPVSHSYRSINAYLRVRLDTKEPRTSLLRC